MMMNQVDSSSFDNDKDDGKSPKNDFKIESTSFKKQEEFDFKIQEKMNSRFKKRNKKDFTREVLKSFFSKNKHSTIFFSK